MGRIVNDENARPSTGPNDSDRTRFGFTKTPVRTPTPSRITPRCLDMTAVSTDADFGECPRPSATTPTLDVLASVHRIMGDPDAAVPLLRSRSVVGKYDYKNRILELAEQNRALRAALAHRRDQHRDLVAALAPLQDDLNRRLQTDGLAGELQQIRRQFDNEMQKLQQSLQDRGGAPADESVQRELQYLRQLCEAEASRANSAEMMLQERNRLLEGLAEDLENAQSAERTHARIVEDAKAWAKAQVDEASQLLKQHIEESSAQRNELRAELSAATSRIVQLESRLMEAGLPVPAPVVSASPSPGSARDSPVPFAVQLARTPPAREGVPRSPAPIPVHAANASPARQSVEERPALIPSHMASASPTRDSMQERPAPIPVHVAGASLTRESAEEHPAPISVDVASASPLRENAGESPLPIPVQIACSSPAQEAVVESSAAIPVQVACASPAQEAVADSPAAIPVQVASASAAQEAVAESPAAALVHVASVSHAQESVASNPQSTPVRGAGAALAQESVPESPVPVSEHPSPAYTVSENGAADADAASPAAKADDTVVSVIQDSQVVTGIVQNRVQKLEGQLAASAGVLRSPIKQRERPE